MKITRISGPVVFSDVEGSINDLVRVGKEKLLGEIIEIRPNEKVIQVYEDTTGLKPGEPVKNTKKPLSVQLGPGLLGGVFDGTQRPLNKILEKTGKYIQRGIEVPVLEQKKWEFKPTVKTGTEVHEGQIIGEVKENSLITHKVLVPPGINGKITGIKKGKYTNKDVIAKIDGKQIKLSHSWPVRVPRPINKRLEAKETLISGTRILDFLFPVPKGGLAAIPGPFGAGKTVTQQQFAKWCDADIIVYIGCGERGNEMTDVLEEFPELKDPKTGEPLMNRTVLIANTSNMPVAAREASVYTGITIAEYFRDQGYKVALMADSTSRWAEAMREISGRLEEMPGEEGYPAYLSKRLAEFYERAGYVETLGKQKGSITVIGAVSPPGGDFSEPVTQNTLRIVRAFWALDASLADKRHYPAIDWLKSYSLYHENLEEHLTKMDEDWKKLRIKTQQILEKESKLKEIVQLVGLDSLPKTDQILMLIAKMIREDFLQQNAFHEEDTYSSPKKTLHMIKTIIKFYEATKNKELDFEKLKESEIITKIANMKYEEIKDHTRTIKKSIEESLVIHEV
ncbi:MAG: V-type ATP synthase subunit A [Candidatus Woesearchaeota archaeon]